MPPLRRLISIAYASQAPFFAHGDEVEREPADARLPSRGASPIFAASRVIAARSSASAGKRQPRNVWPLGPPSSWSCVESSSTSPSGVTRSCTLGLRNSSPDDALLDDAARRPRAWPGSRRRSARRLEAASRERAPRSRSLARRCRARAGRARSTRALPSPDTPSFSLTRTCSSSGFSARIATIALTASSTDCRFSTPSGCGTPSSRRAGGSRSSCRGGSAPGRRRTSGCRAASRGRARARSCCTARGARARGSGISARMRSISRGRSSSFSVSGRDEPSSGETRNSRFRAWDGITPGSRSR